VTSIDVTHLADVSQTTVPRAFTTPDIVAPDKRERIYATAFQMRYVPNTIAQSLASRSSRIVAVVALATRDEDSLALIPERWSCNCGVGNGTPSDRRGGYDE